MQSREKNEKRRKGGRKENEKEEMKGKWKVKR
jgi:hypothetical protein